MSEATFQLVTRPVGVNNRYRNGMCKALRETLQSGEALAFPCVEETYAVVRNRQASSGYTVARRLGCALRTSKSADGKTLFMWLEKK